MKTAPILRPAQAACATCTLPRAVRLQKLGVDMVDWDYVVALPGNPNTGKSTVFNALTGLHQHTGNWPGKTVRRAEGGFQFEGKRYKLIDLPGTYSLLASSPDEEVTRDFILFGQPDVTVIVVDATRLERNLNLVLQILEITGRAVVCLNLMDEARRHGLRVDCRQLARDLGVPVVPTVARRHEGLPELLQAISEVAGHETVCLPHRLQGETPALRQALQRLSAALEAAFPGLANARWIALRLLGGDERVSEAVRQGELAALSRGAQPEPDGLVTRLVAPQPQLGADTAARPPEGVEILALARALRHEFAGDLHERVVETIYADAARIAGRAVTAEGRPPRFQWDQAIDRLVTSRLLGFPVMLLLFALVFWITISGANIPSRWLSGLLIDTLYPALREAAAGLGFPWWLRGLLIDGMYLATAWVVSVMLPPMAIFFPLFSLLEDFGYLPRVAFNLDPLFQRAGAHGKQSLSMMMGYGCNAAGVIATRIIDSPRERLIAILTNNFALCNGRWPTQILIATLFIGSLVPARWAGLISAGAVLAVTLLGILLTFVVSWALSRTILKGHVSTFSLELPPYRPPRLWQTLYTSLIDRTGFVLWRAVVFALPAGAVIWLSANVRIADASLAEHLVRFLDPPGLLIGLNGVILLAYLVAIPANEIVIPTVLMLTVLMTGMNQIGRGAGVMFDLPSHNTLLSLLQAGGWTLLTAVNLMLFSLIHNPCSTTIYTIYQETGSARWTAVAALLPLGLGFLVTFAVAQAWRLWAAGG